MKWRQRYPRLDHLDRAWGFGLVDGKASKRDVQENQTALGAWASETSNKRGEILSVLRKLSRSAYEASLRCLREYYYRFIYKSGGLEETQKPIHLAVGLALHKGMETGLKVYVEQLDKPSAMAAGLAGALLEWGSLVKGHEAIDAEVRATLEALIRGWWLTQAERFFSEWEIVSIEEEGEPIELAPGVPKLAFRADVVVRNKYDSALVVVNWKTASSFYNFREGFESDIQPWVEAECVERALGEEVVGCLMEGFLKGALKDGHFSSALTRPWVKDAGGGRLVYAWDWKTVTADKAASTKRGERAIWERINAWEHTFPNGFGVKAWVEWLPVDVVASYFTSSGFIKRPPKAVIEHWLTKQMVRRAVDEELVLRPEVSEDDRLAYFYQHFGKWTCGTENEPKCAFRKVCFGQASLEELLASGVLEKREDHH